MAVNVAAYQLTRIDLPTLVDEVLKETGLAPERLEIELTESGLIADHARALATITRLKALGVSIAMDDFGTGYSSLALLQHFPSTRSRSTAASSPMWPTGPVLPPSCVLPC
ncbi:EAL domain-containing protein [Pannonibacter sp. Pt2-lr]